MSAPPYTDTVRDGKTPYQVPVASLLPAPKNQTASPSSNTFGNAFTIYGRNYIAFFDIRGSNGSSNTGQLSLGAVTAGIFNVFGYRNGTLIRKIMFHDSTATIHAGFQLAYDISSGADQSVVIPIGQVVGIPMNDNAAGDSGMQANEIPILGELADDGKNRLGILALSGNTTAQATAMHMIVSGWMPI